MEDKDKRCLQQLLQWVQQLDLDAMTDYDSWQSAVRMNCLPSAYYNPAGV